MLVRVFQPIKICSRPNCIEPFDHRIRDPRKGTCNRAYTATCEMLNLVAAVRTRANTRIDFVENDNLHADVIKVRL